MRHRSVIILATLVCVSWLTMRLDNRGRRGPVWLDWSSLPAWSPSSPILSQNRLHELLSKFRLQSPASTTDLLHFWRLWAAVDDEAGAALATTVPVDPASAPLTISRVKALFLNDETFRDYYRGGGPWLNNNGDGPIVVQKYPNSDANGETHPDEFLSVLAECRVGLREPVYVGAAVFTVDDLLRRSTERYVPSADSAFSTVAIGTYLATSGGFTTKSHDWVSFDTMLDTVTSQPLGGGPCHGTHNCYAVAAMLNLQRSSSVLSPSMQRRANKYLEEVASHLAAAQHHDGAWRADWPSGTASGPPMLAEPGWGDAILVTGHHLEWMALVPFEVLPPERLGPAMLFVAAALERVAPEEVRDAYPQWSHAMRALITWEQRRRHSL